MVVYQLQHVETRAGRLAVWTRDGTGLPLLLWPSILFDHSLYDEMVAELPNPVAIIDGPGHGLSPVDPANLGIASLAQAAGEIAARLFARQEFAMIGTSWGSLIAAELAAAGHPLLRAVILFNAPWKTESRADISDHVVSAMARVIPGSRVFRNGVARSFFAKTTLQTKPDLVAKFMAQQSFTNPGLYRAVRSVLIERHALPAAGPQDIGVPALVLAGEHDSLYLPTIAREMAGQMPRGSFELMPGTAHISAAEAPVAAARLVRGFLDQCLIEEEKVA